MPPSNSFAIGTGLTVRIAGLPAAWQLRQFRDGNRILIHALPGKVETILHPTLKNQINNERIVEILEFTPLTGELRLEASVNLKRVELHSPDLSEPRREGGVWTNNGLWIQLRSAGILSWSVFYRSDFRTVYHYWFLLRPCRDVGYREGGHWKRRSIPS